MMASKLTSEKDPDPTFGSVSERSPSGVRVLGDQELDVLLRRAGLAMEKPHGANEGPLDEVQPGGRRFSDGDCRVGQCTMPRAVQRLATVQTFTAVCCALATLTGCYSLLPMPSQRFGATSLNVSNTHHYLNS